MVKVQYSHLQLVKLFDNKIPATLLLFILFIAT